MLSATIDLPILVRLNVDLSSAVRKGGALARKIIVARTRAGLDAEGRALPSPKPRAGQYGPTGRPFYRSGQTIEGLDVTRPRKLSVRVTPMGYHAEGKGLKAAQALRRSGAKLSAATVKRLAKAAGAARAKKKGKGGKRGTKGGAVPLPLVLGAVQAGAVGGKKAGYREPVDIMNLSSAESARVQERMTGDVTTQVNDREVSGSAVDFRNVRRVLRGER